MTLAPGAPAWLKSWNKASTLGVSMSVPADAACADRVITMPNRNGHVRLMSTARSIWPTFSPRQCQSNHAPNGNRAADQRAKRGPLVLKHEREGDDHNRRDGQDGKDNACRSGFQRPLHATDPQRLTCESVDQHPGPHPAPLLQPGFNDQLVRGLSLELECAPLDHQQAN